MKVFLPVLLSFIVLLSGCAQKANTQTDKSGLFSVGMADGWVQNSAMAGQKENSLRAIFKSAGKNVTVGSIAMEKGSSIFTITLNAVVFSVSDFDLPVIVDNILLSSEEGLKKRSATTGDSYNRLSFKTLNLSQFKYARELVNERTEGGKPYKEKVVSGVSGNYDVTIVYKADPAEYDNTLQDADSMIFSFKLVGK